MSFATRMGSIAAASLLLAGALVATPVQAQTVGEQFIERVLRSVVQELAVDHGTVDRDRGRRHYHDSDRRHHHKDRKDRRRGLSVKIPPGHYPPPGSCRVWYPDRPPGHQPPPTSCDVRLPRGAVLVRG